MSDATAVVEQVEETTKTKTINPIVLRGQEQNWNMGDKPEQGRRYITVNANFGKLRKLARVFHYNPSDNTGEQRAQKKAHVNKLKAAIKEHKFTPTSITMGIRPHHQIEKTKDTVVLSILPTQPLPILDGGHRFAALEELRAEGGATARMVDNLPITAMVMLDHVNTVGDFINLQAGAPVDKSHLLTMSVNNGLLKPEKDPICKMGLQIAKLLHSSTISPIQKMIKFDSLGEAPIKLASILSSNASDISSNVYGSAKIAIDAGKDAEWMAGIICMTYENIQSDHPELLKPGKVLCPPPEGTRGGASMLVGVGNMMAYRLKLAGRENISKKDAKVLKVALDVFVDEDINGNFSSNYKKKLMGRFADLFFNDICNAPDSVVVSHDGVPISLINLLSSSAFGVTPAPKPEARRGRPRKNQVAPPDNTDDSPIEGEPSQKQDSDTDEEWTDEEQAPWDNV